MNELSRARPAHLAAIVQQQELELGRAGLDQVVQAAQPGRRIGDGDRPARGHARALQATNHTDQTVGWAQPYGCRPLIGILRQNAGPSRTIGGPALGSPTCGLCQKSDVNVAPRSAASNCPRSAAAGWVNGSPPSA